MHLLTKVITMKTTFFFIIIAFFFSLNSHAQSITTLKNNTERYLERFPHQKVYLHLDKDEYFSGDIIWFKAYITNAHNHIPDILESTLFTELYNAQGTLIARRIVRIDKGYGMGDFSLPDSIIEGNYVLKAYTPWMLNFDDRFIYSKNIFINNPESKNFISRRNFRENRRFNRGLENKRTDFEFEIFPESGNLVYGLTNRIAYHAFNSLGEGIPVNVQLVNSSGVPAGTVGTVAELRGKGLFEFTPERNERYSLVAEFPDGRSRNYPIRNIRNQGYLLRVDDFDDLFRVTVQNNYTSETQKAYLVLHTRGVIKELKTIEVDQYSFDVKSDELPNGIVAVSLFDSDLNLVSERLFFNLAKSDSDLSLYLTKGQNNTIDVTFESPQHPIDTTTFSIAILGSGPEYNLEVSENILSHMYLTSDLTGIVEDPAWYFKTNENNQQVLDLLMLTSVWERFEFDEIMEDKSPRIVFRRLDGFPVFGNIEPTESSKELERFNFEVTLELEDEYITRSTNTNRAGDFRFDSLKIFGDFKAEIAILGLQGSKPNFIEIFPDVIKDTELDVNLNYRSLQQDRGSNWTRTPSIQIRPSDRRIEIRDELPQHPGRPDQVIYLTEQDELNRTLRDILRSRVSGLSIDGNSILIRGPSSLILSNEPLLLVDGMQYSNFQFLNLRASDISHLQIYKGSSATIFGIRGANGAIVAHTRRSSLAQRFILEYVITGYYVSQNFSELEGTLTDKIAKYNNYQHTLYWNPYLELDEFGRHSMSIDVPDNVKLVNIILEGIDAKGRIFHQHSNLEL